MGKRGTKVKPDALKKLQGTDRLSRINDEQPKFNDVSNYDPDELAPDELKEDEAKIWSEIVPQFKKVGIMQQIDIAAVSMLCIELAEYRRLHAAMVDLDPSNDAEFKKMYKIGQLKQMKFKSATQLMIQYGMTPVARQTMRVMQEDRIKGIDEAIEPKPVLNIAK